MTKWILVGLAVVIFAMACIGHFRAGALEEAERKRMAEDNARRQDQPGGAALIEVNPDVGRLQAEALLSGEVWFILPPVAWALLGMILLVTAGATHMVGRSRKAKSMPPAGG